MTAACALASARGAGAQAAPSAGDAIAPPREGEAIAPPREGEVDEVELLHRESIATRRALGSSVFVAGLVSLAGGGALLVPDADDQAWRYAGINTAIFGAVNTVVGLLALHGIAREELFWESVGQRASRRTREGLIRARIHAAIDERRESVGHAINLGLDAAYVGVGTTAVVASQLGVDHPNRWLASGVAIWIQAAFLIGVDFIGLTRSAGYHRAFLEGITPTLAIVPTSAGSETRFGLVGTF